ncbi:hypothetical protein [Sphingobium xenophagum]|uniref:Uncharacterized protein n=1 Tax=Sphingobium xenophagum TaxID=121428 RepID=A0A401IXH4_SPHXE|nr:hypothetical protein [Sphingobium xenophagum]GBH29103.1 hypothetical protein MBESOW_P0356 [Sphingobium xenophagum]
MQFFRILGVWLVSLSLTSLLFGGLEGFIFVFLVYGMFMTLPALAVLAITLMIEGILIRRGHPVITVALGPVIGLVVPVALFIIAPNKNNALSASKQLIWITVGTGLVWALSYLWVSRHSLFQSKEAASD